MTKGYKMSMAALAVSATAALVFVLTQKYPEPLKLYEAQHEYSQYLSKYGKSYDTKEEYTLRMK